MRVFFQIAYFAVGLVQLFAIWDGVIAFLGVGSAGGFLISVFLTYIPLVGSAAGVYGAVEVWDWSFIKAVVLFFWYVPVAIIFIMFGTIFESRR